ncbi:stage VI sporulation protein D [Priestia megaterium]|uniref:stage VI sporulation protein D n=1 Tax=Priestia megaterium TaxID=1404 RepID=UPI000D5060E3|nr:stage VI sporulation protein D [Priestia megaterium]PVE69583.1 stage VI sporulation protein D [Priestia megaterium]PVE90183.1 stage VI sporulation protein D [Priestia megaterium]PVE93622.1 stage VI sporulation protein D [Priestia megaterium]PVF00558.1 stage VI sporulation protein D [Priestia megaterium]
MSQDNLSCLRFSVEESVWFQKGQEVSQLLSISLEPQVSIQEYDQYVSIRGALQLTGEYETYEGEHSLREYTNENQVQSISVREDGTAELSHQFPVDITIPKNRIQSIEDVYVSIDLFDYELPGTNQLQLMADLSITGLYGEQHEEREEEEEFSEEQHIVSYEEVDDAEEAYTENFAQEEEEQEFDVSYREAPALLEAEAIEEDRSEEPPSYFSSVFKKESRAEQVVEYEEEAYEPFEVEVKKEAQIEEEREDNVIELFQLRQEQESFEESQASELNTYADVQQEAKQEEEKIIVEFRKEENENGRNENALYLTKLFSREEEAFSTWKLCIVQDGDSLDMIANRYNTNVQNILRVNNLEDEYELEEGSILNIPVR